MPALDGAPHRAARDGAPDAGIHVLGSAAECKDVDGRDEPGHDGE
jgi:hypothetical protein